MHIGSQITDMTPFNDTMKRVADLVRSLRRDGHTQICGRGGRVWNRLRRSRRRILLQRPGNMPALCLPLFAGSTFTSARTRPVHCRLGGRFTTRVIYTKTNGPKKFLVVDAAMNDLLRPSLYKAYHEIVAGSVKALAEEEMVDVVGPICETGDFFARDRALPVADEGDLLAILDAGAYGMVWPRTTTRARGRGILVIKGIT